MLKRNAVNAFAGQRNLRWAWQPAVHSRRPQQLCPRGTIVCLHPNTDVQAIVHMEFPLACL
eukprot:359006-Chlamydomonas_euryale.AAC.7